MAVPIPSPVSIDPTFIPNTDNKEIITKITIKYFIIFVNKIAIVFILCFWAAFKFVLLCVDLVIMCFKNLKVIIPIVIYKIGRTICLILILYPNTFNLYYSTSIFIYSNNLFRSLELTKLISILFFLITTFVPSFSLNSSSK